MPEKAMDQDLGQAPGLEPELELEAESFEVEVEQPFSRNSF